MKAGVKGFGLKTRERTVLAFCPRKHSPPSIKNTQGGPGRIFRGRSCVRTKARRKKSLFCLAAATPLLTPISSSWKQTDGSQITWQRILIQKSHPGDPH